MQIQKNAVVQAAVCLFAAAACVPSQAAEYFAVRYNIAGSLGGEMFAPPDQSGWGVGTALTYVDVHKVTGNNGKDLTVTAPGGTVPLAAGGTPYDPSYAAQKVTVHGSGPMTQLNLGLAYLTPEKYADGRLAFLVNLSFGSKKQTVRAVGDTPALNWPSSAAPDSDTKAYVGSQFSTQYQSNLAALSAAETGEDTGLGDTELQAGWMYNTEKVRTLIGASVVVPTAASYDKDKAISFGTGPYYTFRPAVQVAYLPTEKVAIAGKLTLGFNTTNTDTKVRSGNWIGAEAAAGYMTPYGPVGLHMIHIQQVQDDSNNMYGASRFRTTNAGVFFTTKIPAVDVVVTAQTMASIDSANAKHGFFNQIRFYKLF